MEIIFLSVDLVLWYDELVLSVGGASGIRSEQQLASAVFQPQQSAFGEDAYPSVAEKAAAYGFFLTANHPFVDGNKRTGAMSLLAFLELNEYELRQTTMRSHRCSRTSPRGSSGRANSLDGSVIMPGLSRSPRRPVLLLS
jgi:death-on-curing protein